MAPVSYLSPVTRYSRFVLLGKKALWVLAVVLTVALVVTAWINSDDPSARIVFAGKEGQPKAPDATADMLKPRYQGLDSHNRPFNIIADKATQQDSTHVWLENLSADMTLEGGAWLAVTAAQGQYNTEEKRLELNQNVSLFYEGGYEFRTDRAVVNIDAGEAWGDSPVEGQGPSAVLKANSFKVQQKGAILQFNDAVKVTLYL